MKVVPLPTKADIESGRVPTFPPEYPTQSLWRHMETGAEIMVPTWPLLRLRANKPYWQPWIACQDPQCQSLAMESYYFCARHHETYEGVPG